MAGMAETLEGRRRETQALWGVRLFGLIRGVPGKPLPPFAPPAHWGDVGKIIQGNATLVADLKNFSVGLTYRIKHIEMYHEQEEGR